MALSDIIGRVIELHDVPGRGINRQAAIEAAVPLVMEDAEVLGQVVRDGIGKRIKDMATKRRRAAQSEDGEPNMPTLFGDLRVRYPLDDTERVIKRTEDLTRIELRHCIQVRRAQVKADEAHLKAMEDAERAVAPFWDANPGLTFGGVMALYLSSRAAAE
jgi:hypothetical protein